MNSLYARRGTPFVVEHIGTTSGKILDLRIHWTAADKIETAPAVTLAPGDTRLLSVTDGVLVFVARHPLYTDTYFRLEVATEIAQAAEYTVVGGGAYNVLTPTGTTVYMVWSAAGDVGMSITNPRITMVLDLSYENWVDTETDTGLVEPFNVIFDYLPRTVTQVTPTFIYTGGSKTLAGNYFTNTPATSGGEILPTAHRFSLSNNILTFLDKPEVSEESGNKIISINGVRADHGGITIKTLV